MESIKNIQLSIIYPENLYRFRCRFSLSQAIYSRAAAMLLLTMWLILSANIGKAQPPEVVDTSNIKVGAKESEILGMGEEMPVYKYGGEAGMMKFLANNIQLPDGEDIYGIVYVTFTIDTLGKVTNAAILRGINSAVDAEAIRVVKLLEYIPGTLNGKSVPVNITLPIKFK